jgi:2-aminobenzoate-CoA ligase
MHSDPFVAENLPPREQWPDFIFPQPNLQFAADLNCVNTLFNRVFDNQFGDRLFLRCDQVQLTYRQTHDQVLYLSAQLQAQGLVPGNRVLLRGSNSVGMAVAWLAVVYSGLVAVATMPLLRAKELSDIIAKANISFALCDQALLEELSLAQLQNPQLKQIVSFNAAGHVEMAPPVAAYSGQAYRADTDDIALLAFTSGTTGVPKAAAHSHRDVLAACECWPKHNLQATADDIVIGSPPLAFTFGLGGMLLFPMWAGCSVYYPNKPYTPENMVDVIHQVQATISYTAPTFYRQMLPFVKVRGTHRLRISVSAGEALPLATRQAWKLTCGLDMLDGIGATELFHIFITSHPGDLRDNSLGKLVPGYEAKIVDDDGNEVPVGSTGKLAVRGPTGCKYLRDARQTSYVKQGWNYPGDAFYCDSDGYYYYQSRADDMIISAGYNIAGPEVESCLLLHPDVAECAVVGAPDLERGMIVKAFVVLKGHVSATDATTKMLQDWVKQRLAPYKYPRAIVYAAQLPKTETGKLQRYKLRQISESSQ